MEQNIGLLWVPGQTLPFVLAQHGTWSDLEILAFFTIDIYTVPLWALPKHRKTQRIIEGQWGFLHKNQ